jgi:toxin FitB
MNVVDSSGWLEYLANGTNASFFSQAITTTDSLVVPAICLYEVFKRILSQRGEEDALHAIGIMSLGSLADITREIAIEAAYISDEYKMAMADSLILATARAYRAVLWTQDADFEGVEGVQYIQKK